MQKVGLIVNPIAGLGGSVGLKGSDGREIVERALALGATPQAERRSVTALEALHSLKDSIDLYTFPGAMGERVARVSGFLPIVLETETYDSGNVEHADLFVTTAADTVKAAERLLDINVDLLLFTGGDGTARNVFDAIGNDLVVVGIPAGVKIHSGVYAVNPRNAGLLAYEFLTAGNMRTRESEVMDIDEEAFREERLSARLYGYMRTPASVMRLQGGKMSISGDMDSVKGIARYVSETMEQDTLYIVGPGSTTAEIMETVGLPNTLLGVDLVLNRRILANDVGISDIVNRLDIIERAKIIVTPIGGQGSLFGRGNQQVGAPVLRRLGKTNIIVVASQAKLNSFYGQHLITDTGDMELDEKLSGYLRVITGYRRETVFPLGY